MDVLNSEYPDKEGKGLLPNTHTTAAAPKCSLMVPQNPLERNTSIEESNTIFFNMTEISFNYNKLPDPQT